MTSTKVTQEKVQNLINAAKSQFDYRSRVEGNKHGMDYGIAMQVVTKENEMWLSFRREDGSEEHTISIPVPFERNGVQLIRKNEVLRAVCPFWIEAEQHEVDFLAAMYFILLGQPKGLVAKELVKKTPYLQQMVYGFNNGNAGIVAYKLQKAINEVISKMPLHETDMNSLIANNRLIIIDEHFDELSSPEEKLRYQVAKAKKYFANGWTSIGLSDGSLVDNNYILKFDLRRFSPFGERYHNPQRNLFSTLGMKGDEDPIIRSESMQSLMNMGIKRKGWNWFTAFVDLPDVFEDQIIVDSAHIDKFVDYDKRLQVFGKVCVKVGDRVRTGDVIGLSEDGDKTSFETICDYARVSKITEAMTIVGGIPMAVSNVIITYKRFFCDGFKLTNLHGNKGVIRIMDLGYAIDPITGKERKIDVIVGAKTIGKRKNYGQVMEALVNCITDADRKPTAWDFARLKVGKEPSSKKPPIIIPDNWAQSIEELAPGLLKRGYNSDALWECNTYAGKVKAVCGTVFWGCIKTPQDQLWKSDATVNRNLKELRTAGHKFSHIEFRSIETRFGVGSPVMDEIMSYLQGSGNISELITMVKTKKGLYDKEKPTYKISSVKPLEQNIGTVVDKHHITGTVVDEGFGTAGFFLEIPFPYMSIVDQKGEVVYEGAEQGKDQFSSDVADNISAVYMTDRIYLPNGVLRKCWKHQSGKFGLSEVGVIINNVVVMSNRLMANTEDPINWMHYYKALYLYFQKSAAMLCGKDGEISNHSMSVRCPFSVKATATLSTTLPKNTVEIHRSLAEVLGIGNGGSVEMVERYPCLGFVSVLPQKVVVTDDPMCKYTIRASGNSLVSSNLDFDGDTLYITAFHTPAAKKALLDEWTNPNKTCYDEIERLNNRKGAPHIKEFKLNDFNMSIFKDLSCEEHAAIVEKNTGVKAQTGPVISLTYNLMRLTENSDLGKDLKSRVSFELFAEKAAQSVFEQKHGGVSLHEIVMDSTCTADVEALVNVGFKRGITEKVCGLVRSRAAEIGITNLVEFHEKAKKKGSANVISVLVREMHKIYHASRSSMLEGIALLDALDAPAVDIPSRMFKWVMAGNAEKGRTALEEMFNEKALKILKGSKSKDVCSSLFDVVDNICFGQAVQTVSQE